MSTFAERAEATAKIINILTGFQAKERSKILEAVAALMEGAPPEPPTRRVTGTAAIPRL